jgi:hypothetical protein
MARQVYLEPSENLLVLYSKQISVHQIPFEPTWVEELVTVELDYALAMSSARVSLGMSAVSECTPEVGGGSLEIEIHDFRVVGYRESRTESPFQPISDP